MHAVTLIPVAASLLMIGVGARATASNALQGSAPESLEDFQLPPKMVFDKTMPRYPNVWFHVDTSLAPSYREAVKLVTDGVRESMRLREFFPPFDNPEACDFEARIEHLQPWQDKAVRALQHSHAFHMRYYYSALAGKLEQVVLNMATRKGTFYRFGASVHYEVEHTNPNHADVESCPICGRTGDYASRAGNLVELVHDPLGLELLLSGTIRGERVRFEDYGQREVGSIAGLGSRYNVSSVVFPGLTGDRNTLRIGVVVISGGRPSGP
jgi:hypothetical protein